MKAAKRISYLYEQGAVNYQTSLLTLLSMMMMMTMTMMKNKCQYFVVVGSLWSLPSSTLELLSLLGQQYELMNVAGHC